MAEQILLGFLKLLIDTCSNARRQPPALGHLTVR